MKLKSFLIAFMVVFCISGFSTVQAMMKGPKVYGTLNFAAIDETAGDDWHFQAAEATLGAKGMYIPEETKAFKLAFNLELNVTGAINDSDGVDDVKIENAVLAFITDYGTFVGAPHAESGHQKDMYAAVDQFEVFEADRNGGLYDQPDAGGSVLAYASPVLAGFQIGAAHLNLGDEWDDNDEDTEAWAVRLMYKKKNLGPGTLRAGIGYVSVSDAVSLNAGPGSWGNWEDYTRVSLTGQYLFNAGHNIGFTYEMIENRPGWGDVNTLGIAGKIQLPNNFSIKAAYLTQDDDLEATAYVANLTYQASAKASFYIEFAEYDDITTGGVVPPLQNDLGFIAIGAKLTF